jgi:serine phosphatase RsbU (regulator of sigma subunit)
LSDFQRILLYTDGIVEAEDSNIEKYAPQKLIANYDLIDELSKNIDTLQRDDDITIISIDKEKR